MKYILNEDHLPSDPSEKEFFPQKTAGDFPLGERHYLAGKDIT